MRKLAVLLVLSSALALAPAARANITSVFGGAVSCTTQGNGVRFCGSTSPRSTTPTFDGVPIDVNVAFPPAPGSGPDGPYPLIMLLHGYGQDKQVGDLSSAQRWLDQGYATPAPDAGYTLLGAPTVIAHFTLPAANSQVAARLLDVAPDGKETLVARGLWRPSVASHPARQVFQLHANSWTFAAGHVPKLELLPNDSPYGRASNGQGPVTVRNLKLRLPVLDHPGALHNLVKRPTRKLVPAGETLAR